MDPENIYFDPEPDLLAPQMIDWDEVDRQRNVFVVDYPLRPRRQIA